MNGETSATARTVAPTVAAVDAAGTHNITIAGGGGQTVLMLGGGVRYQGNTLANNVDGAIASTPSYTLYDAMASVTWENWRLQLNGTNIGNTRYIDSCSGYGASASCGYGAGRTVYATLAYTW